MQKLTPGPWKVIGANVYGNNLRALLPMNAADARLIAAAPLLLAALHAALDDIDAQRAQGIEPPDWYQTARNAIAATEV
jgi:hypothetical protein